MLTHYFIIFILYLNLFMGIFSKNHVPDPNVKRNTFDLSFQNNLTMEMGTLYPCFCKEVLPGDTFKIDTAFGLRFMPLVFPIQTKLRADVHYFYVRNRNLWDQWQKFITDPDATDERFPVIANSRLKDYYKTGSLGDYLGLPSTFVGNTYLGNSTGDSFFVSSKVSDEAGRDDLLLVNPNTFGTDRLVVYSSEFVRGDKLMLSNKSAPFLIYPFNTSSSGIRVKENFEVFRGQNLCFDFYTESDSCRLDDPSLRWYLLPLDDMASGYRWDNFVHGVQDRIQPGVCKCNGKNEHGDTSFTLNFNFCEDFNLKNSAFVLFCFGSTHTVNVEEVIGTSAHNIYFGDIYKESDVLNEAEVLQSTKFPRTSALPFRAYESIYNAFYRDQRNNPYTIGGHVMNNEYIPTKNGGSDANLYELRHRNWEQDFLTSALPSPQMGAAPLVGISSTGVATLQADDGTLYNVKLQVSDDGDTVIGAEYTSNIPNEVARSIVNIASSGISINDFRAVNSLQRWLEANFRKGLKYKDQIAAHFGVNTSYAELDMPEFIGGVSQMVDIQQINQTSEGNDSNPLGSYAGQAYAVGGSQNSVQHYCDEHGFIIGIISVVPVPCYSQLLPKFFTKTDLMDYYFPEFGHIGMQPIPYREVCPLTAIAEDASLDSTFGYQRAWYDYLASTDEIHGQFRTTLRDFVLNRTFRSLPSLTPEFLTITEDDLNNVFAVNFGDHILGQVHFKVHAKRPIPRYGIPRLE